MDFSVLLSMLGKYSCKNFEIKTGQFLGIFKRDEKSVGLFAFLVRYEYADGSKYLGDWNEFGQRHGFGHLVLPDSTRYDGIFHKGHFLGLGVLRFPDGAR